MRFISPIPYLGGKAKQWEKLRSYFPKNTKSLRYYEPFFGGGSVGLNSLKCKLFKTYFFSDMDEKVITAFESIKTTAIPSEDFYPNIEFDSLKNKRFFEVNVGYKNLMNFNLNFNSLTNNSSWTKQRFQQNWNFAKWKRIVACGKSLKESSNVVLKLEDAFNIINTLNKEQNQDTFLFLDPPYQNKKLYNFNFTIEQFEKLSNMLSGFSGKFVLTVSNTPEMIYIFKKFNIYEENWTYLSSNAKKKNCKLGQELIITNFKKRLVGSHNLIAKKHKSIRYGNIELRKEIWKY